MKKIIKIIGIIATAAVIATSCNKTENLLKTEIQEMLAFNTVEEYDEHLELIEKMTETEFAQWEKLNGFSSFYSASRKAYAEIVAIAEKEATQEQIFELVKKHSSYLQLIPDEENEGEYVLETVLPSRLSREHRVLNKNQMVQVGDDVFKAFDRGVAKASVQNKHELINLTIEELNNAPENTNIEIQKDLLQQPARKDIFQKEHVDRATSGSERIYLGIEIKWRIPFQAFNYSTSYSMEYTLRPYSKTLGIWYWCTRNISGRIDAKASYTDVNGYYRVVGWEIDIPLQSKSVKEDSKKVESSDFMGNGGGYFFYGFKWNYIDCWGRQHKVSNAAIVKKTF